MKVDNGISKYARQMQDAALTEITIADHEYYISAVK